MKSLTVMMLKVILGKRNTIYEQCVVSCYVEEASINWQKNYRFLSD